MWSEKVRQLLQRLQWDYRNLQLYEQALTHSSYAHEKCRHLGYNERLEFLGDAVLELVISDYLYHSYPHLSEGKLTKLRSDLVCEASLARLAYSLDLGRCTPLGQGEMAGGGSSRLFAADAVKPYRALYLDLGLEKCRYCVLALFQPIFQELKEGTLRRDYKTLVQEYAQARFSSTPEYRIVRESGPDHDKIFEAEILIQKQPAGRGIGRSKKDAEQAAAREAWFKLVR